MFWVFYFQMFSHSSFEIKFEPWAKEEILLREKQSTQILWVTNGPLGKISMWTIYSLSFPLFLFHLSVNKFVPLTFWFQFQANLKANSILTDVLFPSSLKALFIHYFSNFDSLTINTPFLAHCILC